MFMVYDCNSGRLLSDQAIVLMCGLPALSRQAARNRRARFSHCWASSTAR